MKKCSVCGTENADYLEYCENCASPLPIAEEQNSAVNDNNDRNVEDEFAYIDEMNDGEEGYAKPQRPEWSFAKKPSWLNVAKDNNDDDIDDEDVDFDFDDDEDDANFKGNDKFDLFDDDEDDEYMREPVKKIRQEPRIHKNNDNRMNRESATMPVRKKNVNNAQGNSQRRTTDRARTNNMKANNNMGGIENRRRSNYKKRSNSFGGNNTMMPKVIIGSVAALVLVIIIFFVIAASSFGGDFIAAVRYTFTGNVVTRTPSVEKSQLDSGEPAYILKIYSKNGNIVRFSEGETVQEATVQDGVVKFRIAEQLWIPNQPTDGDTYKTTPNITIINAEGKETKVEMPEITIDIPKLELEVVNPSVMAIVTEFGIVDVNGKVGNASAQVFLNDKEISVDSEGNFSGTYQFADMGAQTLIIEGRLNGYSIARKEVQVDYSQNASGIKLDESVKLNGSDNTGWDNTLTVTGSMPQGATIKISGVTFEGTPTFDSTEGRFSFKAVLPEIGLYTVTIESTLNGVTTTKIIFMEHMPNKDTYTRTAYKFDNTYENIMSEPHQNQGYKIDCEVVEIIRSTPYKLIKVKTTGGHEVLIEYYHDTASFEVGQKKAVYGFPDGIDEETGLLKIYAWFVYNG